MSSSYINVIGAGLAGSEAAYQIAKRGIPVKLYEMRGVKSTPQHKTADFRRTGLFKLSARRCADQCSRSAQGRNAAVGLSYLKVSRGNSGASRWCSSG